MQQGSVWHLGKLKFSVDLETLGENTQLQIQCQSEVKVILFYERNMTSTTKTTKNGA